MGLVFLALINSQSIHLVSRHAQSYEDAAQSRAHAYSCAYIALFELSADINYIPHPEGDVVTLSKNNFCTIESIETHGTTKTVLVSGESEDITTRLEITLYQNSIFSSELFVLFFRKI